VDQTWLTSSDLSLLQEVPDRARKKVPFERQGSGKALGTVQDQSRETKGGQQVEARASQTGI
jgi:hypothetical protein